VSNRRTRTDILIVLTALLALVVTSVSGATAMAAGPVLLDIFGNPICADGSLDEGSPQRHDKRQMPDCCLLACAAMKLQAGVPPQTPQAAAPTFEMAVASVLPDTVSVARGERTPANPRAPPRTA